MEVWIVLAGLISIAALSVVAWHLVTDNIDLRRRVKTYEGLLDSKDKDFAEFRDATRKVIAERDDYKRLFTETEEDLYRLQQLVRRFSEAPRTAASMRRLKRLGTEAAKLGRRRKCTSKPTPK